MSDGSGHWDADLFRREGHRMVDWIAEYLDGGNRAKSNEYLFAGTTEY